MRLSFFFKITSKLSKLHLSLTKKPHWQGVEWIESSLDEGVLEASISILQPLELNCHCRMYFIYELIIHRRRNVRKSGRQHRRWNDSKQWRLLWNASSAGQNFVVLWRGVNFRGFDANGQNYREHCFIYHHLYSQSPSSNRFFNILSETSSLLLSGRMKSGESNCPSAPGSYAYVNISLKFTYYIARCCTSSNSVSLL